MTTISSSLPTSAYSNLTPAVSAGVTSDALTSDAGLPQTATALAADASVIATLGGSASASSTYSAAGLLDSFVQAGSSSSTQASSSTGSAQQSLNQAIVGSLTASTTTSGIYTSTGGLQNLPTTDVSANWTSILKTNPEAAKTVAADSVRQGIVNTL